MTAGVPVLADVFPFVNGGANFKSTFQDAFTNIIKANNGVSVKNFITVFGQAIGEAGDPAALLSNREIPMGGFNVKLKTGNFGVIQALSASTTLATQIPYAIQSVQQGGAASGILAVQALAGLGSGGAVSMYHTRSADANTPLALGVGDFLGTIKWYGVDTANAVIECANIKSSVVTNAAGHIDTNLIISLPVGGVDAIRMAIASDGSVLIGTGAIVPVASSILSISGSGTKGMLLPSATTAQKNAIAAPATLLTLMDSDRNAPAVFDGVNWEEIPLVQQSRVAANFAVTNSAVLVNITGLTANVSAGKTYRFRAFVPLSCIAAQGFTLAIAGTATATAIIIDAQAFDGVGGAAALYAQTNALGNTLFTGSGAIFGSTNVGAYITGTITVNAAGTLTVQLAQDVAAPATAATAFRGSFFEVTQIA